MQTSELWRPRLWTPAQYDHLTPPQKAAAAGMDWNALTTRERIALFGLAGAAGNYTDLPDHRIEYDQDGTALIFINASDVPTEQTSTTAQSLNDEDSDGVSIIGTLKLALIFPDLRDIVGYFTAGGAITAGALERSANSTNGVDGTWVSVVNPFTHVTNNPFSKPTYRNAINTVSINAMKAIRFNYGGNSPAVAVLNIYGKRSATATQYLTFWRPNTAVGSEATGDARMTAEHFDWGNTPRSSSADRKFRVKNEHGSLTASDVTITIGALTDTTPSVPGQFLFSSDGVNFAASLNIGNLAAGALSADLWIRRTTPANAVLSVWSARVLAEADGGWA